MQNNNVFQMQDFTCEILVSQLCENDNILLAVYCVTLSGTSTTHAQSEFCFMCLE